MEACAPSLLRPSPLLQWHGGGSVSALRINALAAVKENGRGVRLIITAACLAQAFAATLSVILWCPGVLGRVVLPARLSIMCLRHKVSVETL